MFNWPIYKFYSVFIGCIEKFQVFTVVNNSIGQLIKCWNSAATLKNVKINLIWSKLHESSAFTKQSF